MAELASNTPKYEELLAAGFSQTQALAVLADAMGTTGTYTGSGRRTAPGETQPYKESTYTGTRYATPSTQSAVPKTEAGARVAEIAATAGAVVRSTVNANETADSVKKMLATLTGDIKFNAAGTGEAAQAEALATAELAAAKAAGQVAQFQQQQKIVDMVGLNPVTENSILQAQLSNWAAADARLNAVLPIKTALESVNPFANPIAWLAAQAQLRPVNAEAEAAAVERQRASKDLADRQQVAQGQRAMIPSATADSIVREAKATADIANAKAKMTSVQANVQASTLTMQAIQDQLRTDQLQIQNNLAALQAISLQLNYETEQGLKADEELDLHRARRVMELVGGPRIESFNAFKQMDPALRREVMSVNPDTASAGDMVNLITTLGTRRALALKSKGAAMTYDHLVKSSSGLYNKMVNDPNDKRTTNLKQIDAVNQTVDAWNAQARAGDLSSAAVSSNNPHRMNALEYAQAPGLEGNEFAKFVKTQDGKMVVNYDTLLTYGITMMKEKSLDEITDATVKFFTLGGDHQYSTRQMATMGIDKVTDKSGREIHPIGKEAFGLYSGFGVGGAPKMGLEDAPIDFRNPVQVKYFYANQIPRPSSFMPPTSTLNSPLQF